MERQLLAALVAAAVLAQTAPGIQAAPGCDYGRLPGVWSGDRYELLDKKCPLVRYVDHMKNNPQQTEVSGEIFFIGDSLNRNLMMDSGEQLGVTAEDYTPFAYDDRGRPEKIGRNAMLRLGRFTAANLFHFGANEVDIHWLGQARAGIPQMHNSTYGRVCLDGPKYLRQAGLSKDPYMIVINSNYWDAMHHSHTTLGPPPKKDRSSKTRMANIQATINARIRAGVASADETPSDPPVASSGRRRGLLSALSGPAWEGQVADTRVRSVIRRNQLGHHVGHFGGPRVVVHARADRNVTALVERYLNDIRDLVAMVKKCYPNTKLFCWHTAPLVDTNSRNPHWYDKRPHVVAALNAAARFVAKELGLCLLDWDLMFQGRNNDPDWVPDGLHPAPKVSLKFLNLAINIMMHHQGRHHGSPMAFQQAMAEAGLVMGGL